MVAEVKIIYQTNARNVVDQLRKAADSIESGKADDVRGAVFVLAAPGGAVDVYAWGDLDNYMTLGVLERAKRKVHEVIDG